MTILNVSPEIQIEVEKVLDGVAQLDTPELEQFLTQVSTLLAQRKATNLSKRETELLLKINQGLSSDLQQQYDALMAKLQADTISPPEHKTLLDLIDQIEQRDADRMKALVELAQLRNLPLETLLNQLGIHPPPANVPTLSDD